MLKKILLLGLINLVGCQSLSVSQNQDHFRSKNAHHAPIVKRKTPPSGPISRLFQFIVPTQLTQSKAHAKSYRVHGQRYQTLTSARGYKERGIASWYGRRFQRNRTSSGERFDMHALTAAHKVLPIGTYVRVKNLENHRVVIVKINDRGPFRPGRIIDLSYAAASKLGMQHKGSARVELDVISIQGRRG